MDARLTLSIKNSVIKLAKGFARNRKTSLSELVESFLGKVTETEGSEKSTCFVKSLSGTSGSPKKFEAKEEYKKHKLKKYA
jgi:hypothetical protein